MIVSFKLWCLWMFAFWLCLSGLLGLGCFGGLPLWLLYDWFALGGLDVWYFELLGLIELLFGWVLACVLAVGFVVCCGLVC